jgi:integrase
MNKENILKVLNYKQEGKRKSPTVNFILQLVLAGMDVEQALDLKVSDIDFAKGKLKDLTLTQELTTALGEHLGFCRSRLSSGMLFTGAYKGKINKMTKDNLATNLHKLCKNVGLSVSDLEIGLSKPVKDIGGKRLLTSGSLTDIQKWLQQAGVIGAPKETAATKK